MEIHKQAIDELFSRMVVGEITPDECKARQLEHAEAIAAVQAHRSQDAILNLVRTALDHPKVVEAIVVGFLHLLQLHGGDDGR